MIQFSFHASELTDVHLHTYTEPQTPNICPSCKKEEVHDEAAWVEYVISAHSGGTGAACAGYKCMPSTKKWACPWCTYGEV